MFAMGKNVKAYSLKNLFFFNEDLNFTALFKSWLEDCCHLTNLAKPEKNSPKFCNLPLFSNSKDKAATK